MASTNIRVDEQTAAYLKQQAERLGTSLSKLVGQVLDREAHFGPEYAIRPVHLPPGLLPSADELGKNGGNGPYFAVLYEGPGRVPTAIVVKNRKLLALMWEVEVYGSHMMLIPRATILGWIELSLEGSFHAHAYLAMREMANWGASIHPAMPRQFREPS